MDRNSMQRLRLDRRLLRRRGWIEQEELDSALAALPDVADKIAPDEPEEEEPAAPAPPAPAAPEFPIE